jgi:hypothetical protein
MLSLSHVYTAGKRLHGRVSRLRHVPTDALIDDFSDLDRGGDPKRGNLEQAGGASLPFAGPDGATGARATPT